MGFSEFCKSLSWITEPDEVLYEPPIYNQIGQNI